MRISSQLSVAVAMLLLLNLAVSVAADPAKNTEMIVGEMCGGCVKRITARLKKMPEIADIKCDIKTRSVTVVPAEGKVISASVLWAAMDEIGKTPKKMVGPSGTFTSKPAK